MIQNKYEIQTKIGNGKFGSVFLGENRVSKKPVAIKIEEKEGCIRNESRILEYLARNGCKNIANIFWYGVQEKYTFLVMTYIDGISLSKYLDSTSTSVSVENVQDTWISLIKILEKIHSVGVIHRDIKPDHFLFWKNEWYLIDFGFATFSLTGTSTADFSNENITREHIIGTPNYISTNIHNGFSPTARDDLISLGYIFLEIGLSLAIRSLAVRSLAIGSLAIGSLAIRERLPWSRTVLFPNETSTEYTECHILHIQNQYKKKYKEKWENENPEHLVRHYLHDIYSSCSEDQETCIYTKLINRIKQYK